MCFHPPVGPCREFGPATALGCCHQRPKFVPPIYTWAAPALAPSGRTASTSIHGPSIHPSLHPLSPQPSHRPPPSDQPITILSSSPGPVSFVIFLRTGQLLSQPTGIPSSTSYQQGLLSSPIDSCPVPPPHPTRFALPLEGQHLPRFHDSHLSAFSILPTFKQLTKKPTIAATCRQCCPLVHLYYSPINPACRPSYSAIYDAEDRPLSNPPILPGHTATQSTSLLPPSNSPPDSRLRYNSYPVSLIQYRPKTLQQPPYAEQTCNKTKAQDCPVFCDEAGVVDLIRDLKIEVVATHQVLGKQATIFGANYGCGCWMGDTLSFSPALPLELVRRVPF